MASAARSALIGTWALVSFTERDEDGRVHEVWGPNPRGTITYTEAGTMSVVFASSARSRFSGAWDAVSDADKARQYDAMVAYAGRYTDFGDRVVHHVDVCWIPNWEGRDLERYITYLDNDQVLLRTPPSRFGRSQPVQDVIVRRVHSRP